MGGRIVCGYMKLVELTEKQMEEINTALEEFDEERSNLNMEGNVTIGIEENGQLVAGLLAGMSAFRILYVSTVFVKEECRRKGYGKFLMNEMEKRAKELGANMIRLDTFDYQGKDFYKALGYEQVGFYRNDEDNFEEYFFVKRI